MQTSASHVQLILVKLILTEWKVLVGLRLYLKPLGILAYVCCFSHASLLLPWQILQSQYTGEFSWVEGSPGSCTVSKRLWEGWSGL